MALDRLVYMLINIRYTPKAVSDRRLFDAIDIMLSMQNSNGGFASYEPIRGPSFLEYINPAEVFGRQHTAFLSYGIYSSYFSGNIMIEYSYPECTTSVLTALSIFKSYYPDYRRRDIEYAVDFNG